LRNRLPGFRLCGKVQRLARLAVMRDDLFTREAGHHFTFDTKVAAVFDEMVERSVPFYTEVQRMVIELALNYLDVDGVVYDIGCSTGTTLAALASLVDPARNIRFVGLEPAAAMREQAVSKLATAPAPERLTILPEAVENIERLDDARVIMMLYTLQFIRPMQRLEVLKMCQASLQPGGCIILAEKILAEHLELRDFFIASYHAYKRRAHYSELEIARKREALENVLIPFTAKENVSLLQKAGFSIIEPIFQWFNFAAYLAVKT
jgi:tRNA (cmo5U34)-methyltransferase